MGWYYAAVSKDERATTTNGGSQEFSCSKNRHILENIWFANVSF